MPKTEKEKEATRKWKRDNPGYWKAYKANKPEERSKRYAKWALENPEQTLLKSAKARAKKRGIEFAIDLADIIIPDNCPIFGMPLAKKAGERSDCSPSLDRIDPAKGYVKENVWVISWRANHLKSNASLDELETLVAAWRKKLEPIT